MMQAHHARPGQPQFTERLLERLRADCAEGTAAGISVENVRQFSRNTVIYKVRSPAGPLICKAELDTRPALVEEEYRMLSEMRRRLEGSGLRSLTPVAVYPDLRVLVTREESGGTVRHRIQRGVAAPAGSEERRFVATLVDQCADALYRFHAAFGLQRNAGSAEVACSYLDFDPRNLIAVGAREPAGLVLLDPPRELRLQPVHSDIGVFCFGMARAGLTPRALARGPQKWVDHLKAVFVAGYFRRLGRQPGAEDIARIREAERERARRLMARYAQFRQYPNWLRELARMAYFTPLIGGYLAFQLNRSYQRVGRACLIAEP